MKMIIRAKLAFNVLNKLLLFSTLTKHITPPTSSASRQLSVAEKREAFIDSKKSKMKQVQSMIEKINGKQKLSDVISQHSDGDVPYTSLLTNECVLDTVLKNEGRHFYTNLIKRNN